MPHYLYLGGQDGYVLLQAPDYLLAALNTKRLPQSLQCNRIFHALVEKKDQAFFSAERIFHKHNTSKKAEVDK